MKSDSPGFDHRFATPISTIRKGVTTAIGTEMTKRAKSLLIATTLSLPTSSWSQNIVIAGDVSTYASLSNQNVSITGRSELRITNATAALTNCQIHLDSPDAWLILTQIPPGVAITDYLSQVVVQGSPAVADSNVRVVQHAAGTAIIPHSPSYLPLQVFSGPDFTGPSLQPSLLSYHRGTELGAMNDKISSFKLKRGYMATFAQDSGGTGISKVFIAQDGDVEVNVMPPGLDDSVSFVRVFPWASVGKKGWSGGIPAGGGVAQLDLDWHYDWDNYVSSSRETEYVPMRHNRNWNSWTNINNKIGSTHVLGFNEPDRPDQANMTVDEAIALWPNFLSSGLRIGSPAPASANWTSNADWLGQFIEKADALNYRVDYVVLHFYQANYSAQSLYDYLKAVHVRTKRPIWITEMNNGANWTDSAQPNLTQAQNSTVLQSFVQIMDSAPFVERYAMYNWVGDNRALVLRDTTTNLDYLTAAGQMYRDHKAPAAFTAEAPPLNDTRFEANYPFDGDTLDSSGNGSSATSSGTPQFVPGKHGQALQLDGVNDFVQLPPKITGGIDFTFAAWVKWDGGANFQRIFDFGSDTYKYMFLTPKSGSNTLRFSITENSYQNQMLIETTPLTPGVWTHVAVTLKGNTGKLFVNGVKSAESSTMTINPVNLSAWCNYLGKSQFPADPRFAGAIDDVVISDIAYPDAQIAQMATNTPPGFIQHSFDAPDGIAGRYYRSSLVSFASDSQTASAALRYTKAGGPAWLNILPDGTLFGTPSATDTGSREFAVMVTDPSGSSDMAVATLTIHPGTPEPVSQGAVAHYRFEGHTRSGIGSHHGTASGNPAYTTGQLGQAIRLDAVNDYVSLPAGVANSEAITIASWVKWDGGSTYQRLFDFGTGTSQYMFLTPKSASNTCRFSITTNGNGSEAYLQSATALPVGTWCYVAVTLDGTTGTLWINGTAVDSKPIPITPAQIAPTLNYIGKSQFTADPLFYGTVDEFHILDRALSGPELAQLQLGDNHGPSFASSPLVIGNATAGVAFSANLANSVSDPNAGEVLTFVKRSGPPWLNLSPEGFITGTPGSVDAGPNRFAVSVIDSTGRSDEAWLDIPVNGSGTGASAAYAFEGNAVDHAGSHHGTIIGTPSYLGGRRGQAIHLNGSTDQVTLPAAVANHADITIAAWVRWSGGAIWQRLFDFGAGTDKYMFVTPKSGSNTLRFAIKASSTATEERLDIPSPPPNTWYHLALSLEGSTGRLYLNGREVISGTIATNPSDLAATINYIGDSQFAADPMFGGDIDDFQIHGRALSAAEVASLYEGDAHSSAETFSEWAQRIFGGGITPAGDADHDGTSNLAEFRLGLDPSNPQSSFRTSSQGHLLSWPSAPGIGFRIFRSESLAADSWQEVTRIPGVTGEATWSDPSPPEDKAFYRVSFSE